MKTPLICLTVVVVACIFAAVLNSALAQTKPAAGDIPWAKVATCDVTRVFSEYQRVKDVETRMTGLRRGLKAEDDRRAKEILALEAELKDSLKPGSEAYDAKFEELTRRTLERETWQKMMDSREAQERRRLAEEIYKDALRAISQVAKDQGCHIVLNGDQTAPDLKADIFRQIDFRKVLYSDAAVDLTEAVLARLNKTYQALPR